MVYDFAEVNFIFQIVVGTICVEGVCVSDVCSYMRCVCMYILYSDV
jgi:hypothetical protein